MTDDTNATRDRVFDILSSPRRRYALYYCSRLESPIELTDLAEEAAAWENETTVEQLSSQDRKRVYVSLYQTHVPKLAEAGLVEYDSESGEVRLTDGRAAVDPYIGDRESTRPWQRYYMTLAAVHVPLVAGATATIPPLSGIGLGPVALVVIGSCLALTAAHQYATRRAGRIPLGERQ